MKKFFALVLALAMTASLAACGGGSAPAASGSGAAVGSSASSADGAVPSCVEDGVLTVAMECGYAPYNWSQPDGSNDAVPIRDTSEYANGYDVMMAKKLCEANGWELEIVRLEWESLVPAVQSGAVDAVIAGQSMTAERAEQVDFAGPYLYASIICLTKADSAFANAKGISDLAGGSCTSQQGTIWYETCLPRRQSPPPPC